MIKVIGEGQKPTAGSFLQLEKYLSEKLKDDTKVSFETVPALLVSLNLKHSDDAKLMKLCAAAQRDWEEIRDNPAILGDKDFVIETVRKLGPDPLPEPKTEEESKKDESGTVELVIEPIDAEEAVEPTRSEYTYIEDYFTDLAEYLELVHGARPNVVTKLSQAYKKEVNLAEPTSDQLASKPIRSQFEYLEDFGDALANWEVEVLGGSRALNRLATAA